MRFYLRENIALTEDMIYKYIEADKENYLRMLKLNDYYKGKHDIFNRNFEDETKPNNRVVNSFATYITDMTTGYFMGKPVEYVIEDNEYNEAIKKINEFNYEFNENANLAKDASIFGYGVELVYLDNNADIKFHNMCPIGTIMIYSDTIDPKLLYFIRYYDYTNIDTGITVKYVDVYSKDDIKHYIWDVAGIQYLSTDLHVWGEVPVIIYQNSREEIGDFERVIPLIDAYDELESNSVDDSDYFSDAYLLLSGVDGTTSDDLKDMKENRAMLLPEGADARWLIKQVSDNSGESLKTRISEDIHKFSFTPSLTDKDFASNASGISMKYKLMGLENMVAKKERSFKQGLRKRYDLINKMLEIFGNTYNTDMSIIFTRNIPSNITEMADIISKVGHLYSQDTQRKIIPLDIDTSLEEQKIEDENVENTLSSNNEDENV